MTFHFTEVAGFISLFFYASFFEWVLHRFLMHQPIWSYPFKSHALIHHGIFRSGPTYFLTHDEDLKKVRFAWWNAPMILGLHVPLLLWIEHFLWRDGGPRPLLLPLRVSPFLHACAEGTLD